MATHDSNLPKFHGGILADYSPWGQKESDKASKSHSLWAFISPDIYLGMKLLDK